MKFLDLFLNMNIPQVNVMVVQQRYEYFCVHCPTRKNELQRVLNAKMRAARKELQRQMEAGPPDDLDLEWDRLIEEERALGYASDTTGQIAGATPLMASEPHRPEFPPPTLQLQETFPRMGDEVSWFVPCSLSILVSEQLALLGEHTLHWKVLTIYMLHLDGRKPTHGVELCSLFPQHTGCGCFFCGYSHGSTIHRTSFGDALQDPCGINTTNPS